LLLVAALWCIGVFGGNVHAIVPGRAYRSATLTGLSYTGVSARLAGNDLDSVLRRDHIATVICLRGGSPANDWYREEIEVCNREHAVHEDVPISARSLPPPDAMARLLDIFDHARYPILLHCQGGSDRAGLASTIYANLYGGVPLDRAEADQLTWRYGHIPVDRTRAMDAFFDLYRRDAHGMGLREWILRRYPAAYLQAATAPAPNR
jgi:protein tyrosine/serine phosphatase